MKHILTLFFLCFASVAAAQETVQYEDLSQSQKLRVIQALIEDNQPEQAQTLLANTRFDEDDLGYEAAFFQAVLMQARGELEEAESLLRSILDDRPEFQLVRFRLAEVLAQNGRIDAAQFQLNLLAESAADVETRNRFEEIINQISPENPFQFSSFFTISPSSNYNNGATSEFIEIGGLPFRINNTAQSGVGVTLGGSASFTIPLGDSVQAYVAFAGQTTRYPEPEFDSIVGSLRLGVQVSRPFDRFTFELSRDRRLINDKLSDNGYGGRFNWRHAIAPQWQIDSTYRVDDRDYAVSPSSNSVTHSVESTLRHSFSPVTGVRFGLGLSAANVPANEAFSYRSPSVVLGVYHSFSNGISIDAELSHAVRTYQEPFPLLGIDRVDYVSTLRVSALSSRIQYKGITPRISLTYRVNRSNISLYDNNSYGAELTLTRAF